MLTVTVQDASLMRKSSRSQIFPSKYQLLNAYYNLRKFYYKKNMYREYILA